MSEIILAIIVLALIGFIAWRELNYQKQIKELIFIVKSQDSKDFDSWKATEYKPVKDKEEKFEEIDIADLTPEQVKIMKPV